jgi:hypothetical protein
VDIELSYNYFTGHLPDLCQGRNLQWFAPASHLKWKGSGYGYRSSEKKEKKTYSGFQQPQTTSAVPSLGVSKTAVP